MIIEVSGNKFSIEKTLNLLDELPRDFKPLYFSEDEGVVDKESDKWESEERFKVFKENNPLGYYVYSRAASMDFEFTNHNNDYSSLFIEITRKSAYKYADKVLKILSMSGVVFGMACMWEEYKNRNQVMKTIGQGDIYSFVGCNLKNNFSGIYWKTLMSKSKIEEFGVNMEMLKTTFNEVEEINGGNYILCTAYDDPLDWERNAEKIDEYCANDNAFFSKRKVEKLMESITEREDYMDLLQEYS